MMTTAILNTIANGFVARMVDKGICIDADINNILTLIGWDDVKAMSKEVRNDFYAYALDRADDEAWWDVCGLVGRYIDEEYYNDNIDAFHEYESHMDEPNFDWDFYSDWHKDMYGFRPR